METHPIDEPIEQYHEHLTDGDQEEFDSESKLRIFVLLLIAAVLIVTAVIVFGGYGGPDTGSPPTAPLPAGQAP